MRKSFINLSLQLLECGIRPPLAQAWLKTWPAILPLEPPESQGGPAASLFEAADLPPAEKKVFALLRSDESTHIDQLIERLSSYLFSSEIFSALFELELSGRIRQLPGKYYVRVM
jgi:predicted Rossmann fold nucleotide-binding protein DprA/Smf involved in DNA uptake